MLSKRLFAAARGTTVIRCRPIVGTMPAPGALSAVRFAATAAQPAAPPVSSAFAAHNPAARSEEAAHGRRARHRRDQARRRLDHALDEAKRLTQQHDRVLKGPRHGARREAHLFEIRKAVHNLALSLTTGEFVIAANDELFALLKVCKVANASGATHLAAGALEVLVRQRLVAMNVTEASKLLLFLMANRDHLPASHLTVAVTACVEKVLHAADDNIADLTLSRAIALLSALQTSTLIPATHGYEYLRRLMRVLPNRKHEIQPWHVASVCRAVCHYRYADASAVDFFTDAVDVCLKNLDALSPKDAANILDAFATVRYHPTRLFLELGQIAGDHGEELSDADAARVINAFEKTDIDASKLRTSLQASMRMRSAFRVEKQSGGRGRGRGGGPSRGRGGGPSRGRE